MVAPNHQPPDKLDAFLAELLADQQQLQTPVARASAIMDVQPEAFRGDRFRDLIPLTAPKPGEQYAFEVDLDACSGCKACVSGCHSLNGLDDEETWRDVGVVLAAPPVSSLLEGAPEPSAYQQTITTACHHCADPACLNGCPVLAYEKDPVTGIVRHLDDQCIGCSYCVLKCPYDVPKYNERLGIVRKCDLCHGRLAEGEAPACVQACPTHAIRIVTVSVSDPATKSKVESRTSNVDSPAAPSTSDLRLSTTASDSRLLSVSVLSGTTDNYTQPTTRYVSARPIPANIVAADARALRPQHTHWALVFLLTGTQLGLGLYIASLVGSLLAGASASTTATLAVLGFLFFAAGLAASVGHLGQPLRAWRVFLGLRKSWLSREAVVLGMGFGPLVHYTAGHFGLIPEPLAFTIQPAGVMGAALCTLGVFCSAMIYIDTRRHFWRPGQSFGRMGGTVLMAALLPIAPAFAAVAYLGKLALELGSLRGDSASARLQRGPLRALVIARVAVGTMAILTFLLLPSYFTLALLAVGEVLERALYFKAVDSPKMPGVPA
ncbi:MAG: DmsC/YnfH family molybdoenzyme membrane anchor subunit [Verrucomicrobiota bacterium]